MNRNRKSLVLIASVGAVLVLFAIVTFRSPLRWHPSQDSHSAGEKRVAIDAEHHCQIDLKAPQLPDFALGELTLGSIHLLRLNAGPAAPVHSVAGSCSCLQILSIPAETTAPGEGDITVRYLAVRPGAIDVALAISHLNSDGKEQIQTLRLTGSVGPGDTARAAALDALLKTPLLIPPAKDLSGVVTAATALESVRAGTGMLVDLRAEADFTPHHVVQALHVPAARLSMNGFFAGRNVYLMGDPLVTDELIRARKRLRQQGHEKVFIVQGGVLAWQAAGGQVFQEIDEKLSAASLDAAALFASLGNPKVRILAWNVRDEPATRYYLPGAEVCAIGDWPRRAGEILQQDAGATLVLIDGDGSARIDGEKLPPKSLGRVAFLKSGLTAYRDHAAQLSAIAATKPGSTKSSVRPLPNTGPFEGLALRRGGCGTCPK